MSTAVSFLRLSSLYKAWNKVSRGSRRTSWFFNTAPGVPHVAATYLLHFSAWCAIAGSNRRPRDYGE